MANLAQDLHTLRVSRRNNQYLKAIMKRTVGTSCISSFAVAFTARKEHFKEAHYSAWFILCYDQWGWSMGVIQSSPPRGSSDLEKETPQLSQWGWLTYLSPQAASHLTLRWKQRNWQDQKGTSPEITNGFCWAQSDRDGTVACAHSAEGNEEPVKVTGDRGTGCSSVIMEVPSFA